MKKSIKKLAIPAVEVRTPVEVEVDFAPVDATPVEVVPVDASPATPVVTPCCSTSSKNYWIIAAVVAVGLLWVFLKK